MTEVEADVVAIFAECFARADIALDDDFFAIGGDSLQAAMVLERIFRTRQVRLEPDVFFTHPTPRLLAEAAERRRTDHASGSGSLVPLTLDGRGTPVFLIHGLTPRPWMFRSLVPVLGLSRPVYGTSAPDLSWPRDVLNFDEMVLHYATEIRRMQPRGPYSLVGYSFGGALAFAIASRLVRDGQAVAHLVMLDTSAPGVSPRWLRTSAAYVGVDVLSALWRCGVIGRALARRIPLKGPMSVLRTPLGRVRSSFGPGPMTLRELRSVLTFAFPGYSPAQVRQMSFEGLCALLAEELKRVVSEPEWTRMIRRAGSDAPESVIKGQKLLAKNDRLCHQYRPRCVYEGALTIYARQDNAHVDGWRRYTSRPPDIRRVAVTARPGRDPHRAFISPENVQQYAADLRNLLESAPRA